MLTFTQQQKIVNQLLKRPTNQQCADCNTISPTWASLDFGVFLCSNCSGAHRALGPTVTRVRSTKLDKWQHEWFSNMQIGNKQLNQYWQHKVTALTKKPKLGASLDQVNRYVNDKYMKKKYAAQGDHPLKLYKQNKYNPGGSKSSKKLQVPNSLQQQNKSQQVKTVQSVAPIKKQHGNLLDFQQQTSFNINKTRSANEQKKIIQEQDQFGTFTSGNATDNSVHAHDKKQLTFQELMSQQKSKNISHQNHNNLHGNLNYHQHQNHHHNQYQQNHNYNHNNIYNNYGLMSNNHNHNHNHNHMNINMYQNQHHNQNSNMINHQNNQNNFNLNNQYQQNQYNQHVNSRSNGLYHSLSHSNNNNNMYGNNNNSSNSLQNQQSQQGNYSWLNHQHHYHHQNTAGLDGHLPVNAKFPGQFTPISLHITHSQDKKESNSGSWTDSWK